MSDDGETEFDFGKPFTRLTLFDSILQQNPDVTAAQLNDIDQAKTLAQSLKIHLKPAWGLGKIQTEIFEATVEDQLSNPTFITSIQRRCRRCHVETTMIHS